MALLNVRLTDTQYTKIKEDANNLGLDITSYIKLITQNVKIDVKLKVAEK